jgi:alkylated DNA repair dioxygenase AlkB
LSLGATRDISFRCEPDKRIIERWRLPGGSLLYMTPEMQADWKHAIEATDDVTDGRISLTFHLILDGS